MGITAIFPARIEDERRRYRPILLRVRGQLMGEVHE